MKSFQNKVIAAIVLSLAFLISFIAYWYNYNAEVMVGEIQANVTKIVQSSTTVKYNAQANVITKIQFDVKNNNDVSDGLKKACNDFFDFWLKNNDRVLTEIELKKYSDDIKLHLKSPDFYASRKRNQLIGCISISILFSLTLCLILFANILRDKVGNTERIDNEQQSPSVQDSKEEIMPPFSLSRSQLVTWIFIIASIYLFAILWNRQAIGEINSTALILMGISAGTFAAGAILDTTEIQGNITRHQDRASSGNFFKDILSDENGVSIHRFQMMIWTIIAIIIYFYRYNNPVKPEDVLPVLDSTLLALTGISSATYLTLKTRENVNLAANILKEVKINLDITGLDPAVAMALNKSAEGLSKAVITINTINDVDPVHAAPYPAAAKFSFAVKGIEAKKYKKIKVEWKGPLDIVAADGTITKTDVAFVGESNVLLDTEGQVITIPMKKK